MQYIYSNKQSSHILTIEFGEAKPLSIYWLKEKEEILKFFWTDTSNLVMSGVLVDKLKNFSKDEILIKIRQAVENEILTSDLSLLGVH